MRVVPGAARGCTGTPPSRDPFASTGSAVCTIRGGVRSDRSKRSSNLVKHGVDFATVESFDFDTALVRASLRGNDPRLEAYGPIGDRVHVLVYGIEAHTIRVISLRKANGKETVTWLSVR